MKINFPLVCWRWDSIAAPLWSSFRLNFDCVIHLINFLWPSNYSFRESRQSWDARLFGCLLSALWRVRFPLVAGFPKWSLSNLLLLAQLTQSNVFDRSLIVSFPLFQVLFLVRKASTFFDISNRDIKFDKGKLNFKISKNFFYI